MSDSDTYVSFDLCEECNMEIGVLMRIELDLILIKYMQLLNCVGIQIPSKFIRCKWGRQGMYDALALPSYKS